jgi:ABC-type glycerol-3-phosphate transport system substrate-binding protein
MKKGSNMRIKQIFKVFSIGLVVVLGVSALGLPNNHSLARDNENVSIKIIMEEVPDTDIVEKFLPSFERDTGINVVIEKMPYESMREKILTQLMTPTSAYDVIIIDNPWADEFSGSGFILPLSSLIEKSSLINSPDFAPSIWKIGEYKGEVYMIPFYNYALSQIVRKDLFENETIEDYIKVCEFFTRDTNGDGKIDFWGAAMQAKRGYKIMEEWTNYLYACEGKVIDEKGNVAINNTEGVRALEYYIENLKKSAPPGSLAFGFDEAYRMMATGKTATMITYNWMLAELNDPQKTGELAGKFKLAEVPGGKAVLGAWYWAIPQNAGHKDAAWKFIEWIESDKICKERARLGAAPTKLTILRDPELTKACPQFKVLLKILKDAEPLARGPHAEEIIEIVGLELSIAAAGQKSPKEALDYAALKINELLR